MALAEMSFFSQALMRQVHYSAIIPSEHLAGQERLPTLYLLHGITGTHSSWLMGSQIAQLAVDHRIAVIMPAGDNSFYVDQSESHQYYGEYVGHELVAESRQLFPLSAQREHTAIGGLSMGGYGAIRNGLKYHQTFGAIIALSSALITDRAVESDDNAEWVFARRSYLQSVFGNLALLPGSDKDPCALAAQLKQSGQAPPRIYLACGLEDPLLESNRHYRDRLEHLSIDHTYIEGPGQHDWSFWNHYIAQALVWLDQTP